MCMALQALLASSHLLHEIQKNAANHGVIVDGAHIDIPKMMAQKDKAVTGLTKGVEGLFKKNKVLQYSNKAARAADHLDLDTVRMPPMSDWPTCVSCMLRCRSHM